MAENKKSFILYADLIHTVSILPNEVAGKLFKTILEYVNDKNPNPDDIILQIAFEPIKQQLKRDLKEWEKEIGSRSENGILGNLKRWNYDLYEKVIKGEIELNNALNIAKDRKTSPPDNFISPPIAPDKKTSPPIANIAVNDNVNVNVNVNVKKNKKEFIPPTIIEFKQYFDVNGYLESVAERAWKGYDAANWHDTHGKKVLNWKQKCQNVWFKDENKADAKSQYDPSKPQLTKKVFN